MIGHVAGIPLWQTPTGDLLQQQFARRQESSRDKSQEPIPSSPRSDKPKAQEKAVDQLQQGGNREKRVPIEEDESQVESKVNLRSARTHKGRDVRKAASKLLQRAKRRIKHLIRAERKRVKLYVRALNRESSLATCAQLNICTRTISAIWKCQTSTCFQQS